MLINFALKSDHSKSLSCLCSLNRCAARVLPCIYVHSGDLKDDVLNMQVCEEEVADSIVYNRIIKFGCERSN